MQKVVVAILAMLATANIAAAQPAGPAHAPLTVQGHGRVQAKPDYAAVTAELSARGATLEAATTAHRERVARATEALRKLQANGVQIDRSTFRLDEDRRPPGPPPAPRR